MNKIEGEPIYWPDSHVDRFEAGYDEFAIEVHQDISGSKIRYLVRCLGYIGFQMTGFWDEMIVESARLYDAHAFIAECETRVKSLPTIDSKERLAEGNSMLEILFIDGCMLWVCPSRFSCERFDGHSPVQKTPLVVQ